MQGMTYCRHPTVLHCSMAGEAVLLREDTGTYYGLDDVGASVWAALDNPRSIDAIASVIASEYLVTAEKCAPDIERLIAQLVESKLVEPVAP